MKTVGMTVLDRIFSQVSLRADDPEEKGDILTVHALGFEPEDLPLFTSDTNARLGDAFEELLRIVYRNAHPEGFSQDWEPIRRRLPRAMTKNKWEGDFWIGDMASENKYRAGNGEGSTEQGNAAAVLRQAGLTPVMMMLRKSPNANRYARKGWEVLEDQDTLSRVQSETGVHLEELMEIVGSLPEFVAAREAGREAMFRQHGLYMKKIDQRYGGWINATSA